MGERSREEQRFSRVEAKAKCCVCDTRLGTLQTSLLMFPSPPASLHAPITTPSASLTHHVLGPAASALRHPPRIMTLSPLPVPSGQTAYAIYPGGTIAHYSCFQARSRGAADGPALSPPATLASPSSAAVEPAAPGVPSSGDAAHSSGTGTGVFGVSSDVVASGPGELLAQQKLLWDCAVRTHTLGQCQARVVPLP